MACRFMAIKIQVSTFHCSIYLFFTELIDLGYILDIGLYITLANDNDDYLHSN